MHVETSLITPSSLHGTMLWLQAGVKKPLRSLVRGTLSHMVLPQGKDKGHNWVTPTQ